MTTSRYPGQHAEIAAFVGTDGYHPLESQHSATQAPTAGDSEADVHVKFALANARAGALFDQLGAVFRDISNLQNRLAAGGNRALMSTSPDANGAAPTMTKKTTLLNAKAVANRIGCDAKTVQRWRSAGELPPAIVIGGIVRWEAEDIETWLRSRKENAE